MIKFCGEMEDAKSAILKGKGFDLEEPEVSSGGADPDDDPTDGSVYCGGLEDNLTGEIVSRLAIAVSIYPVRRERRESQKEYVERLARLETDEEDVAMNRLYDVGGKAWMTLVRDLPENVDVTVYAISEPYLVRIFVGIQLVKKGEDKAEKRCMDTARSLVRDSFEILAE